MTRASTLNPTFKPPFSDPYLFYWGRAVPGAVRKNPSTSEWGLERSRGRTRSCPPEHYRFPNHSWWKRVDLRINVVWTCVSRVGLLSVSRTVVSFSVVFLPFGLTQPGTRYLWSLFVGETSGVPAGLRPLSLWFTRQRKGFVLDRYVEVRTPKTVQERRLLT